VQVQPLEIYYFLENFKTRMRHAWFLMLLILTPIVFPINQAKVKINYKISVSNTYVTSIYDGKTSIYIYIRLYKSEENDHAQLNKCLDVPHLEMEHYRDRWTYVLRMYITYVMDIFF
jgi:hypothetical protein